MASERRTVLISVGALSAPLVVFLLPVHATVVSGSAWYPYSHDYPGRGSLSYSYLGYGAVYWYLNHYWIYFGPVVLQVTNSSDSELVVQSVDQNG